MKRPIVVNLTGAPGAGKSTGAAKIFSELKMLGINCELVSEVAKDVTWEHNTTALSCQEYIFGKQSYRLARCRNDVDVIAAAVTKDELLFADSLEKSGAKVHFCTDDGSFGFKGFATDCLSDLLEDTTYDYAFVCGPEIMMKGIFDILEASSIPAQYSLERYMKCALGVCGQCCVDSEGWRICVEGPVFENDKIKQITEFGKYRRDASGVKY